MIRVALDAMSGDLGARECVPAAALALEADPQLRLLLVGQRDVLEGELARLRAGERAAGRSEAAAARGAQPWRERLEVVHASQVVAMHDAAREAVRRRKDSSMRIAVDLVREHRADAAVSSGNTAALTAISHFVLKCLPGIERAPIMSAIPNATGFTHMLDLGANTRATALQLEQFGLMGAIVAREVDGISSPRVGLLNIGEEESKGHEIVQEAHARLRAHVADDAAATGRHGPWRYVGFVEGHDIFGGEVDVVVTDGFTGNVALKTMEGLAELIVARLRSEFTADLPSRFAAWCARPVLRRVLGSLDPRRYNGAVMVGLSGLVIKSHGRADRVAIARAVHTAARAVRGELLAHIQQAVVAPADGYAQAAADPPVAIVGSSAS